MHTLTLIRIPGPGSNHVWMQCAECWTRADLGMAPTIEHVAALAAAHRGEDA